MGVLYHINLQSPTCLLCQKPPHKKDYSLFGIVGMVQDGIGMAFVEKPHPFLHASWLSASDHGQ